MRSLVVALVLGFLPLSARAYDATVAVTSVSSTLLFGGVSLRGNVVIIQGTVVSGDADPDGTATITLGAPSSGDDPLRRTAVESCEKKALLAAANTIKFMLRVSGPAGNAGRLTADVAGVVCELIVVQ